MDSLWELCTSWTTPPFYPATHSSCSPTKRHPQLFGRPPWFWTEARDSRGRLWVTGCTVAPKLASLEWHSTLVLMSNFSVLSRAPEAMSSMWYCDETSKCNTWGDHLGGDQKSAPPEIFLADGKAKSRKDIWLGKLPSHVPRTDYTFLRNGWLIRIAFVDYTA